MVVRHFLLVVRVAPQQELLEKEETENAAQNRECSGVRIAVLESVWNHLEKRSAEQRPDRERHQGRDPGGAQHERERRRARG